MPYSYAKIIIFFLCMLLPIAHSQLLLARPSDKKNNKNTKTPETDTERYVRNTVPPYIAGYKDYVAFRIPTLLVDEEWIYTFAQGRKTSYEDFKGPQHIVFRRSKTRGKKWKPMQVLAEANEGYKCGPMSPVLLGKNRILLMWVEQADGDAESKVFTIKSEDAGNTWSVPNEVTGQVKRKYDRPGKWFGVGPSSGLVKQHEPNVDRIYIVASQSGVKINKEPQKFAPSHLIFSDNEGESWNVGKPMQIKSKEATLVELNNGNLMVNARNNDLPHRVVGVSGNGGKSFNKYDGREEENPGKKLNDCGEVGERKDEYKCGVHSGLLVYPDEGSSDRSFLIFSNPQGKKSERTVGTLQLSENSGKKWKSKTIRYTDDMKDNQQGYSGYSNLAFLNEGNHKGGSIAIIFERGGTSPEDYRKGRALIENESWEINFNTFEDHEEKSLLERDEGPQARHHMIDFKIIPYAAFTNKKLRQSIEEPEKKLKTCVNMDSSKGKVQNGKCNFN